VTHLVAESADRARIMGPSATTAATGSSATYSAFDATTPMPVPGR
jgi:hypothetical protein